MKKDARYRRPLLAGALALVMVLVQLLGVLPRVTTAASASLYLSPRTKSVKVNDTLSVGVYVSTDVAINAAEATVTFPKNLLTVTGVSSSGIFTLWAANPSYSNSAGTVKFSGGAPSPGYKGTAGKIITISFKAVAVGSATVGITQGQVLANDGLGTNVLTSQGAGTYTVSKATPPPTNTNTNTNVNTNTNTAPEITPPSFDPSSNPDQSKWIVSNTVSASWQTPVGAQGYGIVLDGSPDTVPSETVTTTDARYEKVGVADGIWYVHVRTKFEKGWSTTSTLKYQIDVTPPKPFAITVEGDPLLTFATDDATSGVDHYELSLDDAPFATVVSPYQTPELSVGMHTVKVKAYDKAGNATEAGTSFEITGYPQPIVIDLTPVVFGKEPLIIRGFSNAQDSIRLTIDGTDFGPYPVSEYADPTPGTDIPEGKVAWKIDITPNVSAGEHEIRIVAINPDGRESTTTPPVKFRIITNAVRFGNWIIPTALIVNVLIILLLLAVAVALWYAIRYHRLRRHLDRTTLTFDMLKPSTGRTHHVARDVQTEKDRIEAMIVDRAKRAGKTNNSR